MFVNNDTVYTCAQYALDQRTNGDFLDRLNSAFGDVNYKRTGNCYDLNLTAADHYLFMRWLVVKCSPAVFGVAYAEITVYDGIYKFGNDLLKSLGLDWIEFRTGNCPMSEFSPMVMAWAYTGATDGAKDWAYNLWANPKKIHVPALPVPFIPKLFF